MKHVATTFLVASLTLIACANAHNGQKATTASRVAKADTKGSVVAGCHVFPPKDFYNIDISNVRPDPHSSDYINGMIGAGNTSKWDIEPGYETVNLANNATPLVRVQPKVAWHTFRNPWPWNSSFKIEPASDGHAIVLQTQTCHLYEGYQIAYSNRELSGFAGGDWDLSKPFAWTPNSPTSIASGLSMLAGGVRWEEVQAGAIHHALNYAAPAHTVGDGTYVSPATSSEIYTFNGSSTYQLPYGAKLRLKANFDTSDLGPQAKIVAQAMKTYGLILSDTGCCNELVFLRALDGSNPWDQSDLETIGTIPISAFEVMPIGTVQRVSAAPASSATCCKSSMNLAISR